METVHDGVIDMGKVLMFTLTFRLNDGRSIKSRFTTEQLYLFKESLPKMAWVELKTDSMSSPEDGFLVRSDSIVLIEIKED